MFHRAIRKASKYLIYATMLVFGRFESNTDIEPQDRRTFALSHMSHRENISMFIKRLMFNQQNHKSMRQVIHMLSQQLKLHSVIHSTNVREDLQ